MKNSFITPGSAEIPQSNLIDQCVHLLLLSRNFYCVPL